MRVEPLKISALGGGVLHGDLHVPEHGNGAAVVLAPGAGYHRELPLLARSALAFCEAGFVSVRFDWGFHSEGRQADDQLSLERAELRAAMDSALDLNGVERVVLLGKSLGGRLGIDLAAQGEPLAGLILMTLALHEPGRPDRLLPGSDRLHEVRVPTLIITGDADPVCELTALERFLAAGDRPIPLVVVPGDHTLGTGRGGSSFGLSADAAVRAAVLWARHWLRVR
jgi:hypothetical protein